MISVCEMIETVIKNGNYNLTDILKKIDRYHIENKISDEEKEVLYSLAREHANGAIDVDLFKKVAELEARVKELEESRSDSVNEQNIEEYIPGKWYYNGDKCLESGIAYICKAPEKMACTWSPSEYPPYWEVIK